MEKSPQNEFTHIADLLSKINTISLDDIRQFQNSLLRHNTKIFERLPMLEQKILVAISKLTESQLEHIYYTAEKGGHILGLHDLKNHVNFYKGLTTNTDPKIH